MQRIIAVHFYECDEWLAWVQIHGWAPETRWAFLDRKDAVIRKAFERGEVFTLRAAWEAYWGPLSEAVG